MNAVVQHFYGTTHEWESTNPKLYKAVFGFETTIDGKLFIKLGNGVDRWKSLKYIDAENIKGLPEKLKEIIDDLSNRIKSLVGDGLEDIPKLFQNIEDMLKQETSQRITGDQALKNETQKLNDEAQTLHKKIENESQQRQQVDQKFQNELNAKTGNGGRLNAYDFGKILDPNNPDDQQLLTDYAITQIPSISDPLEIWNSTSVKNSFNGNVFILNNTQDTEPPIFEWSDDGPSMLKPFATNIGGFIVGGDPIEDGPEYIQATLNGKGKINLDAIKTITLDLEHPVLDVVPQYPGSLSPIDKGWNKLGQTWKVCNGLAFQYRIRQGAIPNYTVYTPGANYAANAVVMWHLQLPGDIYGDDWAFFKANAAITGAAAQLDPIKWTQLKEGIIVDYHVLHSPLEPDLPIGQQIVGGDYDGWYVEEIMVYGGKFFSAAGGNRPPFKGGIQTDAIRNISGNIRVRHGVELDIGGVFSLTTGSNDTGLTTTTSQNQSRNISFGSSKVVPTAAENQVKNISCLYWRRIA